MLQLLLHSFATKAASPPPRKTVALSSMSIITESIKRCKSVTDIDKLILQTPQSDFTGICCAMAIGKLGQYKSQNVESLNKMLSVAEHHTTFNARSLSSTLHGLAIGRLVSRVPDFLMTRLVDAKFEEFTPQDYATVLWSLAKLEHKHEAVLAKMSKRIMEDDLQGDYLQRFNSQDLANSLWAFATLRYKNEDLYDTLLGELETRKLTKFQSQELVNIMWAFAKVNHTCGDEFAEAVVDEICERDNAQFTPQGISNLLWAYQRLGHSHLRIADKFIQEIVKPTFRVLGK